ncbi:unnamed protein product [Camellia sinensis]
MLKHGSISMAKNHNHGQNALEQHQVVVVMVPFPAQGHLNQLLQLSRLLSSSFSSYHHHIPIHYVGCAAHNRQAKLRVHGWDPISSTNNNNNIHFHDFSTPHFLSPPPNPNASIKFPSHLQPSFDASTQLREPVGAFLRTLSASARRVVVIHDSLMASVVQDVASIPNAESYVFRSVSAFTLFLYTWEAMERPFAIDAEILKDVPSLEGCFTAEFERFLSNQVDYQKYSSGYLYNTSKAIEGPYLNLLAKEQISKGKKHWAIGPFNPVAIQHSTNTNQRHECLKWLDKQPPNSVIYVSFGTTTSFTDEQIRELAVGLEQSGHKFIWVLREADKGDVFVGEVRRAELPKGYEERVKGRGMVVGEWAPQLEILGHPSTGGFVSHCGWNSCMESLSMGVPILAWPMHSDQPRNTVLVTKFLKVGVVLKDWGRREELVTATMVAEVVKRLMGSEEGDNIRKRAAELGGAVREAVAEGGVSRMELDSFVAHISR